MIDFKRNGNDISYNNGVLETIETAALQVKQRLELRLKRFLGEWFLNIEKGIDYFEIVKVKNPNIEVINAALQAEVYKENAVVRIINWVTEIDPENRIFKVTNQTRIEIDTGVIINLEVNL